MTKLCECGCGNLAPIAKKTNRSRGWKKGKPLRFIQGHNGRLRKSGTVRYEIDPSTQCWLWKRSIQSNGYGHLTINNTQILAHRYVYEMLKGKIPNGYELDHLCRNPSCVNPEHLEPVTHAENCRRGSRAILNNAIVSRIREIFKTEHPTISALARQFGVSRRTIRSVIRRESWV
jgi:hypothetical protein